jgi:hypothetical protein
MIFIKTNSSILAFKYALAMSAVVTSLPSKASSISVARKASVETVGEQDSSFVTQDC